MRRPPLHLENLAAPRAVRLPDPAAAQRVQGRMLEAFPAPPDPGQARAQIEVLEAVNAAAEADMLRGNPVTGAHHRAIEAKLKELRALLK